MADTTPPQRGAALEETIERLLFPHDLTISLSMDPDLGDHTREIAVVSKEHDGPWHAAARVPLTFFEGSDEEAEAAMIRVISHLAATPGLPSADRPSGPRQGDDHPLRSIWALRAASGSLTNEEWAEAVVTAVHELPSRDRVPRRRAEMEDLG